MLEINTIPGMTNHSLLHKYAESNWYSLDSLAMKMLGIW